MWEAVQEPVFAQQSSQPQTPRICEEANQEFYVNSSTIHNAPGGFLGASSA